MRLITTLTSLLLAVLPAAGAVVADHLAVAEFEQIPVERFEAVRNHFEIYYGHTSHGSQIVTGLGMLNAEDALFAPPGIHEVGDDLGHLGDTSWVQPTRDWLDAHPECNMVVWSWCGGCSDNTEQGITTYLEALAELESDYPDVLFVYMTGHLDGSGPDGDLYRNNNQIRGYCLAEDKTLFDFADIESWDPNGNYYPNETDACNWCVDWCSSNPCPDCGSCAHSHCFNCYLKGKAFWWLLARADGWSPTGTPPPPAPTMRLAQNHPNPFNPSTSIRCNLETGGHVTLSVHDVTGQRVALLFEGILPTGERGFDWSGRDDAGQPLGSGLYLLRLCGPGGELTRKMTLLK